MATSMLGKRTREYVQDYDFLLFVAECDGSLDRERMTGSLTKPSVEKALEELKSAYEDFKEKHGENLLISIEIGKSKPLKECEEALVKECLDAINKFAKDLKYFKFLCGSCNYEYVHDIVKLKHLECLDISDNNLGYKCAEVISKNLPNLTFLDISQNRIGKKGIASIANMANLRRLEVTCNWIGGTGAMEMFKLASLARNLIYIDMSNNKIDPKEKKELQEKFESINIECVL